METKALVCNIVPGRRPRGDAFLPWLNKYAPQSGPAVLHRPLSEFYQANVGKAARMQPLIDLIKTKTAAAGVKAIEDLEAKWLLDLACPAEVGTFCP